MSPGNTRKEPELGGMKEINGTSAIFGMLLRSKFLNVYVLTVSEVDVSSGSSFRSFGLCRCPWQGFAGQLRVGAGGGAASHRSDTGA